MLSVKSNQEFHAYLMEQATICGIITEVTRERLIHTANNV
jgi:hypothetical protein